MQRSSNNSKEGTKDWLCEGMRGWIGCERVDWLCAGGLVVRGWIGLLEHYLFIHISPAITAKKERRIGYARVCADRSVVRGWIGQNYFYIYYNKN